MMRKFSRLPFSVIIFCAIAILFSFSVGWYVSRAETLRETRDNIAQPIRYDDPHYPFISALVGVGIPSGTGFPDLKHVRDDLQRAVDESIHAGKASDIGIYFRLPVNAHWLGINENDKFNPGSLIKAPIMAAYLKEAESSPSGLQRRIRYDRAKNDPLPNSLPPQLPADTYTAKKLIETMIIDSDNVAKNALLDALNPASLQDIYDEMSFLQDSAGQITPKNYVRFLTRLYNATYINREYSNMALELLTKTTFNDGLVAGVPHDIKVAHKYGERGIYEENAVVGAELHDCGLVYAPNEPYYLCVMTKGTDTKVLASVIRTISAIVYRDRDSFKP